MDTLTTYEFYTTKYFGDTINESSFNKWKARAEDKLKFLTYGNVTEETVVIYSEQLQKATCALMDILYQINQATLTANTKDEINVKSKSSGGESITFCDTPTLITKILSDKKAQDKLMQETVAEYLSGTGLLYAGD